jgi:hypothetical protein
VLGEGNTITPNAGKTNAEQEWDQRGQQIIQHRRQTDKLKQQLQRAEQMGDQQATTEFQAKLEQHQTNKPDWEVEMNDPNADWNLSPAEQNQRHKVVAHNQQVLSMRRLNLQQARQTLNRYQSGDLISELGEEGAEQAKQRALKTVQARGDLDGGFRFRQYSPQRNEPAGGLLDKFISDRLRAWGGGGEIPFDPEQQSELAEQYVPDTAFDPRLNAGGFQFYDNKSHERIKLPVEYQQQQGPSGAWYGVPETYLPGRMRPPAQHVPTGAIPPVY